MNNPLFMMHLVALLVVHRSGFIMPLLQLVINFQYLLDLNYVHLDCIIADPLKVIIPHYSTIDSLP